jgi:crotonobetainyl-CoA:carnitine CoA-transferase CaiB-like acyl-CoA transferase
MGTIPDLGAGLRKLEALVEVPPAACDGPRRWWGGALDVEGLALGSVQAVATALNALTGSPGRYSTSAAHAAAAFDSLGHLRIAGQKPVGFAPMSGFRPSKDGWIRLHANYPHHAARLLEALSATSPQDVDRTLLSMTSLEAEAAIVANKGVAAAVRSRTEWLASPMHHAAASGGWIDIESSAEHAAASHRTAWFPATNPRLPLDGLRVLDLTRVIAGPTATRLLGALGADVLRIDPPQLPELTDAFVDSGFDKRSAEADLGRTADLGVINGLVASADVVVTGYHDGGLDRFGLGPGALLASRPGLVVATLTAWGRSGPWKGQRGFDSLVQAATGIAERYGQPDDAGWKPGALPVQALDHATGYGLAAAVIALLGERLHTGRGGLARMSLARTAEELFALPRDYGDVAASPLPEPDVVVADSPYGTLEFVAPPLLVGGIQLMYREPPVQYGSSVLAWRRQADLP